MANIFGIGLSAAKVVLIVSEGMHCAKEERELPSIFDTVYCV